MFPPRFLPHIHCVHTCERRGAGIARHAARGSGSGNGNVPHVQCMYEIYVSCLGRAGLDWLGSHNDNDNNIYFTPTNCEARNESFLVIPGG